MTKLPRLMTRDRIGDAVLIPVFSILQAVAMGLGAFATRDAFATLHTGYPPDLPVLTQLLGAGLAVALFGWCIKQRAEALGQSYANDLRITIYRHIAGMDLTAVEQRRVGGLSLRFVGDLSAARNWFGRGLPLAISAMFVLPGAGAVLWLLNPHLALAAFLPLAIMAGLTIAIAVGLEARHRNLRSKRATISISMIERVAVAPMLDLLGRTEKEIETLSENGQRLRRNSLSRAGLRNGLSGMIEAGAAIAGVCVLITAGMIGAMTGAVAAALAMIAILVAPLRELALVWDRYCAWRVAGEKAQNLLRQDSANREASGHGRAVAISVDGPVRLSAAAAARITLGPHQMPKDANILRIMAGLDRNSDFKVRFQAEGHAVTPRCAYIGDQPAILQGSLRRALTLGLHPRPKDRRIHRVLADFHLRHLADGPKGLDRRVAEAGRDLSAPEQVRLELARAALARAEVVLIEGSRAVLEPQIERYLDIMQQGTTCTIVLQPMAGPHRLDCGCVMGHASPVF